MFRGLSAIPAVDDTVHVMVKVLVAGAVGAAALGVAGFAWGATVPDERAGEIAVVMGKIGAAAGFVVGAGIALLWL